MVNMWQKNDNLNPIKRSKLRLKLGKAYYTLTRYAMWQFSGIKFAYQQSTHALPYIHYLHSSPLIRQLKDVDVKLQYNKITNLKLATAKLNGIILHPGETFSYWKLIGKPTYKKGYVDGMILFCGSFSTGVGGGLCQLSNLIFWLTLHTPLTIVERYRHSFDVFPDSKRTIPFGSGATCVYPYRDLMIRNDTTSNFQLCVSVTDDYLIGKWCCSEKAIHQYKIIERNHRMQCEYWGGFSRHNELYRQTISKDGNALDERLVVENHALMMYSPFITDTNTNH